MTACLQILPKAQMVYWKLQADGTPKRVGPSASKLGVSLALHRVLLQHLHHLRAASFTVEPCYCAQNVSLGSWLDSRVLLLWLHLLQADCSLNVSQCLQARFAGLCDLQHTYFETLEESRQDGQNTIFNLAGALQELQEACELIIDSICSHQKRQ